MMAKRREKLVEGLVGLQAMGGLDLAAMAGGEVEGGKMIMDVGVFSSLLHLYHSKFLVDFPPLNR